MFRLANAKQEEMPERRELVPAVTIEETQTEIVLLADMPGLDKTNVSVETKGDELIISGSRVKCEAPSGYTALYRERCPLEYRRSFVLNDEIDRNKIAAVYENGVLMLRIAKAERHQPKRISIS